MERRSTRHAQGLCRSQHLEHVLVVTLHVLLQELYAHYADPSTMIACPGLCERRGRIHGPNAVARPQILHDPLTSIRILSRVSNCDTFRIHWFYLSHPTGGL